MNDLLLLRMAHPYYIHGRSMFSQGHLCKKNTGPLCHEYSWPCVRSKPYQTYIRILIQVHNHAHAYYMYILAYIYILHVCVRISTSILDGTRSISYIAVARLSTHRSWIPGHPRCLYNIIIYIYKYKLYIYIYTYIYNGIRSYTINKHPNNPILIGSL